MNNSRTQTTEPQSDSSLFRAFLKNQSEWDWVLLAGRPFHISTEFRKKLSLTPDSEVLPSVFLHNDSLSQINTAVAKHHASQEFHSELTYIGDNEFHLVKTTHIKVVPVEQGCGPLLLGKVIESSPDHHSEMLLTALQKQGIMPDYKFLYGMLRLICDNEPDIIWAKDTQSRYLFVNQAMCDVLLNASDTDEPIGKTDRFFADRENAAHPENPNWYEFGKLCAETDAVVLSKLKAEKFVEQGMVRGKFLALEVYKAPFFDEQGTLLGIVGCGRDITLQLEQERRFQRSEKYFKIFSESLPGAVFICQTDERFSMQFANNEIERLTGYPKEQFVRNEISFFDLITKEYQFRVCSEISNALTERRAFHAIFRLNHKDGKPRWLDIRGIGVYEDNKATRLQGFVSDLTILITAELKQRENGEKYRMLLNNIRDSIYVYSILPDKTPGQFTEVNDIACRQLGYSRSEFMQMTPYHISETEKFKDLYDTVVKEIKMHGESVFLTNHVTKNGNKIPVELFTRKLKIGNQNIGISVSRDLSERIHAQEALEESQLRFETFMKHLTAIAFVRDEAFHLIYVNPSFEKNFGNSVLGKSLGELFPGERPDEFIRADEEVLKYGMVTREYTLPNINGLYKTWLFYTFKVPRLGKLPLIGSVGIDITRQKDVEYELIKAKNDAEQLNRLKTSLLTNLSHEVRTPMNGIIGFSEIMVETVNDEAVRKHAHSINHSAKRLMRTLDSILTLSTLESHIYTYRPEVVNINDSLDKIINGTQLMLHEKKLLLTRQREHELTCFVDRELLEACFQNVLENAIKFTKSGSIHISHKAVLRNSHQYAQIDFSDTGIGIAPEYFHTIFDAFKQVSEGYGREFEGIGLGLTITKKMLELLDGQIEVQSRLGAGSTFSIFIPLFEKHALKVRETTATDHANISLPALEGIEDPSILLVEDNIANIELVQVYLMHKCKLDFCRNVKHALEMVSVKQYHAVLVDIHLGPGLDGVAFVQRLKQFDAYKYIPVIAVTGYVSKTERERIMSAGFNEYIAKPYSRKTLLTCLGKYYPAILK